MKKIVVLLFCAVSLITASQHDPYLHGGNLFELVPDEQVPREWSDRIDQLIRVTKCTVQRKTTLKEYQTAVSNAKMDISSFWMKKMLDALNSGNDAQIQNVKKQLDDAIQRSSNHSG